jgi:predicted ATPase
MEGALALARELGHPQTLVVAGYFAAQLHQLRGDVPLVCERVKEAMELAEEYGLEFWLPYGVMELGWAEAELGNVQAGIEQMQRGMAAYEATGATLWFTYFAGLLAEQLAKAGRVQEGLAMIGKALKYSEESGEKYSLSELHRINGELILNGGELAPYGTQTGSGAKSHVVPSTRVQAEACFAEALLISKQQHTRSWELRALLSLDRFAQRQGQPIHSRLAESYASFSEGFETADLKHAKTRLEAASVV